MEQVVIECVRLEDLKRMIPKYKTVCVYAPVFDLNVKLIKSTLLKTLNGHEKESKYDCYVMVDKNNKETYEYLGIEAAK